MKLNSNSSFSLIEILVTIVMLGVALVYILRACSGILTSSQACAQINSACLLAEKEIWQSEYRYNRLPENISGRGKQTLQARDFTWDCNIVAKNDGGITLKELNLKISWPQNLRTQKSLNINTYVID